MCEPAVARQLCCAHAWHATLVRSLYTLLCMLLREPIVAWEANVQRCFRPCSSCAWPVMLWRLSVFFASVFRGVGKRLGLVFMHVVDLHSAVCQSLLCCAATVYTVHSYTILFTLPKHQVQTEDICQSSQQR